MIKVHMATFPRREAVFMDTVNSLLDQVDEVHVILNEYEQVPEAAKGNPKIIPVIPKADLKDTGKFLPENTKPDDIIVLADDDLIYQPNYVQDALAQIEDIGLERAVYGIHGCIYKKFPLRHGKIERRIFNFPRSNPDARYVDQLGTGTVIAHAAFLPPFSYMEDSSKFVDVRYAKWCFENNIDQVLLAHPEKTITTNPKLRSIDGGSIYHEFTAQSPSHVTKEVQEFGGKSDKLANPIIRKVKL